MTTKSATEFTAPNVTRTIRKSSRIATKTNYTGSTAMVSTEKKQVTHKTVTPKKKSVGRTKKRVHIKRRLKQNVPKKDMCSSTRKDSMHPETVATAQRTSQQSNNRKATKCGVTSAGTTQKQYRQKNYVCRMASADINRYQNE